MNQIISSPSHVSFAEELDFYFFLLSDTSLLKHSQYLYIVIAFPVYIKCTVSLLLLSYNCLQITHLVCLIDYQFIFISLDVRLQNSSVPCRKYFIIFLVLE